MNKSEIKNIKRENNLKRKSVKEYQIDYLDKDDTLRRQMLKPRIDTLQEGIVFNNWLDLFDYLDLYYPDNGNRITYQNRLKRWVNIQKSSGTKLIIKEIYVEPIEWTDERKNGNHSIYISLLSTLLLWRLLNENGYKIEVTYNQFWKMMGLRNSYYGNKEIQKMLPKVDKDMTSDFLEDFFKWTGSKNKSITDYTLDKLQDKGYLKYQKQIMIKDSNGSIRRATDKEESKILSEETKFMKSMGFNSRRDLFMANKSHELYNKVKKNIGISYYDVLSIIIPDNDVLTMGIIENLEELKEFKNDNKQEVIYKKTLNKEITSFDIRSAENRHKNEIKRLDAAYEEYKDSLAIGNPDSKEEFIGSNGYRLFIDDTYSKKFEKATHYFNDLILNDDIQKTLSEVEDMIEKERIEKIEKLNEKK